MYLYIINGCFNCGDTIYSERLKNQIPCKKDIPDEIARELVDIDLKEKRKKIYEYLRISNRLFKFKYIFSVDKEVEEFSNMFGEVLESNPWSIQKTWFKRVYKNVSFSMIAPTGTGKSTFIAMSSVYMASKYKKKIYIILPTTVLVRQMYKRIENIIDKLGLKVEVLKYLGGKKSKDIKEQIKNGDFDILITSNQFLSKNFEILSNNKFDIIYIDDVDAFFRGSKNIEKVIKLLGFTDEDIDLAYKIINARRQGKFEIANKLEKKLEKSKRKNHGILILSSATGRIQGTRVLLYRELLDFTLGTTSTKLRNIIDVYKHVEKDIKEEVLDLVKLFKDGVLIFVPRDQGIEFAIKLYDFLRDRLSDIDIGIAVSEVKESQKYIERFANGDTNVLIGVAHFYGLIVRGLDLPTRSKYAIFTGIPKISINISNYSENVGNILTLAGLLDDIVEEKELSEKIRSLNRFLTRNLKKLSQEAMRLLFESIKENKKLDGWLENLRLRILELREIIDDSLKNEEIIKKLKNHPDVSITEKNGNLLLNIPDIKTYIQASGRTSRLYAGGITKGLSVILVDDEKLLRSLERKLNYYS